MSDIKPEDHNKMWILGLGRNITTVVGIIYRGNSCACGIYGRSILTNMCLFTKDLCDGDGWKKSILLGKDVIKVMVRLIVKIIVF